MSTHTHLAHLARAHGCTLYALKSRIAADTIAEAVAAIRERGLTAKAARAAYDAAESAAAQYDCDQLTHERRVRRAHVATYTLDQRKVRIIERMISRDSLPGGHYSGCTSWRVEAVAPGMGGASTSTEHGEQYSRRCTYRKTNASHSVSVSVHDLYHARYTLGLPATVDGIPVIAGDLVRPGIYRIRLLYSRGKRADARTAFAANQGGGQWHVAATERGAVTALNRAVCAPDRATRRPARQLRAPPVGGSRSALTASRCRFPESAAGVPRQCRRRWGLS